MGMLNTEIRDYNVSILERELRESEKCLSLLGNTDNIYSKKEVDLLERIDIIKESIAIWTETVKERGL